MSTQSAAALNWLRLDAAREADRISAAIRGHVQRTLKRRGVVLGLSGGVDSSVCAALCVRALGADRVFGLLMPETESAPESTELAERLGAQLGIRTAIENITPILEASGCYSRRDAAIRTVVPEHGPGYRSKLVLPGTLDGRYKLFSIVVESPDGVRTTVRLTADAYLTIVAATNFKQRVRKMMEYHYADQYRFAVVGTPNRLEYDQGFFVKNGDGAADLKPIAHLYKTQVYQLAEFLGVPEEIRRRPPTTDTFSLPQSQEEFYFSVSHETLDMCLYGVNNGFTPVDLASKTGLTPEQVRLVYDDIEAKRRAAVYLHAAPIVIENSHAAHTS